jgi:hypothetical protein
MSENVGMSTASERSILIALAALAMAGVVARAHVQAITIDEAVSYSNFVHPAEPAFWTALANNHLLHSMLAWTFARIFNPSHLAVRSAALVGAAVYIAASCFLSTLIAQRFPLRVFLFICLVFNPLILDFLVAARGYGLASGFLLSAICFVGSALMPGENTRRVAKACVAASLCVALSFLSNFSFAFVDAATIVMLYVWACGGESLRRRAMLAAACFLPGLIVAGAVAGPVILHWQQSELNYGAASLQETFASLYQASFYELRPAVKELLFIDVPAPSILMPILALFAAWRASLVLVHWRSFRDARARWLPVFAAVLVIAVAAALGMHWLLFRLMRVPLPKDRTGIYIVILATLFTGILAAIPIPTRTGEITRRGMTILMLAVGLYFLLCLRLHYFKEWKWDADADKLYSVLASYNHACGLRDIAVDWRYDAALNYYRNASGRETLPEFVRSRELPPGKRAYVLYEPEDHDFLANHSLSIVFRTPYDAVIALNPQVEDSGNPCPIKPPDPGK